MQYIFPIDKEPWAQTVCIVCFHWQCHVFHFKVQQPFLQSRKSEQKLNTLDLILKYGIIISLDGIQPSSQKNELRKDEETAQKTNPEDK